MAELTFVLARDRDAWAAIRGYVYQVDLSIQRWLALGPDEALELERGEDIDLVHQAMLASDVATQARLLEQVKHRESRITLRSSAALAALANAYDHQQANPHLWIRFRFTTNADIGRERPSPMPAKLPAIKAWELIRLREMDAALEGAVFAGLRSIVRQATRPPDIPEEGWETFQSYWHSLTDDGLRRFIGQFEWATGSLGAASLRPEIRRKLVLLGHAMSDSEADALYERLFAVLFARLSAPGLKRITRADLEAQLAGSALTTGERALVTRLAGLHRELESRVRTLEQYVGSMDQVLAATTSRLDEMAEAAGVRASLDPFRVLPPPSTEPPPLVAHASHRDETLKELLPILSRSSVLALHGPAASGTTQLALLAARELGDRQAWIRFPVTDVRAAAAHLVAAVRVLSPEMEAGADWSTQCRGAVSDLDVLVLDGVPYFRESDTLGNLIVPFVGVCLADHVTVIMTGVVPPAALERIFGRAVVTVPTPPLTEREIRDVLLAYGSPAGKLMDGIVRVISAVTAGNPVLVQAAAQFLADLDWEVNLDVLGELLHKGFAEPVNAETTRILLNQITDDRTRDLLYRLTLLPGEFGREEMDLLADAPPPVVAKRERFSRLVGPWIQSTGPGRYAVSPLVRALGSEDLSVETVRGCHRVLARRIVARPQVGPWELVQAVTHFSGAGDYNAAGLVLLRGLHAVWASDITRHSDGQPSIITQIWSNSALPEEMDPSLRINIRAYQAVFAKRLGKHPAAALRDVDALLSSTPPLPLWAVFSASLLIAGAFIEDDLRLAAPHVGRVLATRPEVQEEFRKVADAEQRSLELPLLDGILWVAAGTVGDAETLDAWLSIVESLPASRAESIFTSAAGQQTCMIVADIPFLWEYGKLPAQRNWSTALAYTERIEAVASSAGVRPLVAAARGARIAVLGQQGEVEAAVILAERTMSEFADLPDAAFLPAKDLGHVLIDAGRQGDALAWFRRADACPGEVHGRQRVQVKLRVAQLVGNDDADSAITVAESATELARRIPHDLFAPATDNDTAARSSNTTDPHAIGVAEGDVLVARAYGELALARWFADDRKGACEAWERCVGNLLATRSDEDIHWRTLFVTAAYVGAYLAAVAVTGAPPGGDYRPPWRGMLITPDTAQAALFRPATVPFLAVHVMQLAYATGLSNAATSWAERSIDMLRAQGQWTATVVPLSQLAESALVRGEFGEAIRYQSEAAAIIWVRRDQGAEDADSLAAVEVPPPAPTGQEAERQATIDAVVLDRTVLPGFALVADESLNDLVKGEKLARILRTACASEAESSASGAWRIATELCQQVFLEPVSGAALIARSNELTEQGGAASRPLSAIAHLGACVRADSMNDALWYQLHIAEYLQDHLGKITDAYSAVVLPYLTNYWLRAFEQARFRFRTPGLVEAAFAQAIEGSLDRRLPRLLRAAADGLGVAVPDRVRRFLARA